MVEEIPLTLVTKELKKYVRVSPRKWKEFQDMGLAPMPKYRGGEGNVYLGLDIKKFLGLIDEKGGKCYNDPFLQGLRKLGKTDK
ncbi:hypothetical protein [Roseivirga pacifica]|uniref:hypothetical protein n=1 Tax=Roseivirga pacifica TaxID=1267423 RepID=UPI00227A8A8A|nr:hypothetical protein [Roseivirga pacifica]